MGFGKTLDGKYGMLTLSSKETSETHYIDLKAESPATTGEEMLQVQQLID
jgi:hypothetical protein